jgi:integrase/recombinase XerD
VTVLRAWLAEHDHNPDHPLFSTSTGQPLSTDTVSLAVARHLATARSCCPSLADKHVTPHTLRHTTAMRLLTASVDIATIALWLGHERAETTMVYVHADMALKERALARTAPAGTTARRYRPPDKLLAFLAQL